MDERVISLYLGKIRNLKYFHEANKLMNGEVARVVYSDYQLEFTWAASS